MARDGRRGPGPIVKTGRADPLAAIFFDLGPSLFSKSMLYTSAWRKTMSGRRGKSDRYKEGIKAGARRRKFFISFARNQLKSLDSDK